MQKILNDFLPKDIVKYCILPFLLPDEDEVRESHKEVMYTILDRFEADYPTLEMCYGVGRCRDLGIGNVVMGTKYDPEPLCYDCKLHQDNRANSKLWYIRDPALTAKPRYIGEFVKLKNPGPSDDQ